SIENAPVEPTKGKAVEKVGAEVGQSKKMVPQGEAEEFLKIIPSRVASCRATKNAQA
ncbi:hypothetical protein A2U01_0106448, partial [Trifolium medium]|nr:hypothetical protein [Trifolium medium]